MLTDCTTVAVGGRAATRTVGQRFGPSPKRTAIIPVGTSAVVSAVPASTIGWRPDPPESLQPLAVTEHAATPSPASIGQHPRICLGCLSIVLSLIADRTRSDL